MYRGDTATWDFTVTEPAGTAVDLTSATGIRFTAKERAADADVDAVIAKTLDDGVIVTDAAAGVLRVQLADDAGGVYTVATGLLTIKADISRSAP